MSHLRADEKNAPAAKQDAAGAKKDADAKKNTDDKKKPAAKKNDKTKPPAAPAPKTKAETAPDPLAAFPATFALPPIPGADAPKAAATNDANKIDAAKIESDKTGATKSGSTTPSVIGKVALEKNAIVLLHLFGGEELPRSAGSRRRLTLEPEAEGDGHQWRIWLREASEPAAGGKSAAGSPAIGSQSSTEASDASGPGVAIAELKRSDDRLTFAWTAQASSQPLAAQLANCVLEVSAGKGRRFIPLRKTQKVAPLTLALDDNMTARWELDDLPDPRRIRVELRMGSKEPRYRFVGSSTIEASRGSTWIEFMDRRSTEALKLKIESEVKRGVQLTVTPYFQLPGETQLTKFSPTSVRRAEERVNQIASQLELQLKALPDGDGGKGKGKDKNKAKGASTPAARAREQIQQQLKLVHSAQTQLADLREIQKAVDGKGKLHARVVFDAEGQVIELASTSTR
ncbi:MAG TPA: hypothetical protein PLV92_21520 [Pirellulaceae bacterium]|nr:hypothetical protein [Pirellulaceae bacterium]